MNTNQTNYWFGPYNVRVPTYVTAVMAIDGGNRLSNNGSVTDRGIPDHLALNEQQYKEKLAVLGADGYYYYKPRPCDYWLGPYGVRVPRDIESVRAKDGGNSLFRDRGETEKGVPGVYALDEKQYKDHYGMLGADGYYYYNADATEFVTKMPSTEAAEDTQMDTVVAEYDFDFPANAYY
jgi:hypothetical protein